MPTATLYRGSYGLSNRVPPELIPFNADTGVAGLQRADNVLIGEAGQLYCRKGSRQIFSKSSHSPFSVNGGFLFVQEKEEGDTITLALHDSFGNLSYQEIGRLSYSGEKLGWFENDGEYWFSSSLERGIISADYSMRNWPVNKEMMSESTELVYGKLPLGGHIEQHGPRTLSCSGSNVFFSEPGQPSLYVVDSNMVPVHGEVRLLASAGEGVFVSDNKQVWFFSGRRPREWKVTKALSYPAIPYCKLHGMINLSDVGVDFPGQGVVFMTTRGPCAGLPDGSILNLTDKLFKMPECSFSYGSMMLVNDSNLIISLV